MKKLSNIVFSNIAKEELDVLMHIVDETLRFSPAEPKKFAVVDLWNIQRNYRTSFARRFK